MKTNFIKALMLGGCVLALASCNDNSWNKTEIDGFDPNPTITDKQAVNYTLTVDDYATIAKLSANKALATAAGLEDELAAVGKLHYFTDKITAAEYVPALLSDSSFPYFTLSSGSAIKVSYSYATNLPDQIAKIASAAEYTLTPDDYMAVWESDDNYIEAFAPSKQPTKFIPDFLLANVDPSASDYCIVTYNVSAQEPVFGAGSELAYTHMLATSVVSGSKYVLAASGQAATAIAEDKGYGYLGATAVEADNKGIVIADPEKCEFTFTAAEGGYYIQDYLGRYLLQKGDYNNFNLSNEVVDGCLWNVTVNADGSVKVLNANVNKWLQYDESYNSYGSYGDDRGKMPSLYASVATRGFRAPLGTVATSVNYAVYKYNGSAWSVPSAVAVVQPADYTEMGSRYGNLQDDQPDLYLPVFLNKKYPYAQADDEAFVVYKFYSNKVTTWRCDQYIYNGTAWVKNNGIVEQTDQFVNQNGKWIYNPSVTINLPVDKSNPTVVAYYQACTDWVYENIDVPLGSTGITSGDFYVTSYGNNEWYSGTSAYYCEVDLRPASARSACGFAYADMTDDEIKATMIERLCKEVMPGALEKMNAEAMPIEGVDVTYTVVLWFYEPALSQHSLVYKVVGPGKFEFVAMDPAE